MKMYPLEPAGEDLLRRAQAHSVAEREIPVSAEQLFALFEEGSTWCKFFPVIRKIEWTSPKPFGEGTTRTVTVVGGVRLEEVFWTWKPGSRMGFAISAASNRALKGLVELYEVSPLDDQRCKLRWEMGMELNGRMSVAERSMPSSLYKTQTWCMKRLERLALQHRGSDA
jgi:ribosome-associated toxin RatA of RatAB toxin-antitoxin module